MPTVPFDTESEIAELDCMAHQTKIIETRDTCSNTPRRLVRLWDEHGVYVCWGLVVSTRAPQGGTRAR